MAGLTQKQEDFCLAYLETSNATESYRRAYNTSRMASKTVNEKASRLLADGKVRARLAELRAPVREKAQITLESHLARLEDLSKKAEAEGQYSAAITAETNRGRVSGLYVDKVEHSVSGELADLLKARRERARNRNAGGK